jgi:4-aminobutyrate aminotransferase-like enzyme
MVAATDEIADALRGSGFMFFTFTGADAMCAGAAAVLDVIEREHLVERSATIGDVLATRLEERLGDHPAVVELRGRGLFRGIELRASGGALAAAVAGECMARDLWVYPAGSGAAPVTDAIMLGPPLTITEPEVDELVDRLAAALTTAAAHA